MPFGVRVSGHVACPSLTLRSIKQMGNVLLSSLHHRPGLIRAAAGMPLVPSFPRVQDEFISQENSHPPRARTLEPQPPPAENVMWAPLRPEMPRLPPRAQVF